MEQVLIWYYKFMFILSYMNVKETIKLTYS